MPTTGDTVDCFEQSTSFNGPHARVVRLARYDGKTADGSFITTWLGFRDGKDVPMWAGGTFKHAKVRFAE